MKQISIQSAKQYIKDAQQKPEHVLHLKSYGNGTAEFRATMTSKEAIKIAKLAKGIMKENSDAVKYDGPVRDTADKTGLDIIIPVGGFAKVKAFCRCNGETKTKERAIFEREGVIILADQEEYVVCENSDTPKNREIIENLFAEITILPADKTVSYLSELLYKGESKMKSMNVNIADMTLEIEALEDKVEDLTDAIVERFKNGE